MGSISADASRSSVPKAWVKAPTRSFQPSVRIAVGISWPGLSSWRRDWRLQGGARPMARSRATQHISLECRKWRGGPRTSQMPWSGSASAGGGVGDAEQEGPGDRVESAQLVGQGQAASSSSP